MKRYEAQMIPKGSLGFGSLTETFLQLNNNSILKFSPVGDLKLYTFLVFRFEAYVFKGI